MNRVKWEQTFAFLPRDANGMQTVRTDDENEEDKMAFSCVMHLKEECDGCGACEERLKRTDEEAWIAETEM